jgi:hypothetical protein
VEIEHLLYGYFGGVAQFIDEFFVSPMITGPAVGAPQRPSRSTSESWLLRRMFSEADPRNSQPVSDLFKLEKYSDDIEKSTSPILGDSKANFFKTLSTMEVKDLQKLLDNPKTREYLAARPLLRDGVETITELNQLSKTIWFSEQDPDVKAKQLSEIYEAKNTLANQIVTALYRDPHTQHLAVDVDRKTSIGKYLGFRVPIAPEGAGDFVNKIVESLPDTLGINKLRGK